MGWLRITYVSKPRWQCTIFIVCDSVGLFLCKKSAIVLRSCYCIIIRYDTLLGTVINIINSLPWRASVYRNNTHTRTDRHQSSLASRRSFKPALEVVTSCINLFASTRAVSVHRFRTFGFNGPLSTCR